MKFVKEIATAQAKRFTANMMWHFRHVKFRAKKGEQMFPAEVVIELVEAAYVQAWEFVLKMEEDLKVEESK